MAKFVLAFDIYGTLLDTNSITRSISNQLQLDDDKAANVSALWRRYQLEYTWRLNSMGLYEPFDAVTRKSLLHALRDSNVEFTEDHIESLMKAYNILPCFSDTVQALEKLRSLKKIRVVVFSNGTQSMVESALHAARIANLARDTYVADAVKKFKPAPEIYAGLLKATGKESAPEECWLVSGNPFDVTGALAQGMSTIWVDRARKGWTDGLLPLHAGGATEPTKIVHGLVEIADFVAALE